MSCPAVLPCPHHRPRRRRRRWRSFHRVPLARRSRRACRGRRGHAAVLTHDDFARRRWESSGGGGATHDLVDPTPGYSLNFLYTTIQFSLYWNGVGEGGRSSGTYVPRISPWRGPPACAHGQYTHCALDRRVGPTRIGHSEPEVNRPNHRPTTIHNLYTICHMMYSSRQPEAYPLPTARSILSRQDNM